MLNLTFAGEFSVEHFFRTVGLTPDSNHLISVKLDFIESRSLFLVIKGHMSRFSLERGVLWNFQKKYLRSSEPI